MYQLREQIKQTWQAQDAATEAAQAAQSAQTHYRLAADKTRQIAADIAAIEDDLHSQKLKVRSLEGSIQEIKNTCLLWGAISAIVCSIGIALIMQPSRPPQIQPQSNYQQLQP